MKSILICPADRPSVAFLAESSPLVHVPIFGQPLICRWMESFADSGVKDVLVLATDRPEQVRELIGGGVKWGLRARVQAELQELTPVEAQQRYRNQGWECPATILDHLPDLPEYPVFTSYAQWFAALKAWLPRALQRPQIGFHEMAPGLWASVRAQIATTAKLIAPCWIGENVRIGPHAVIGPNAILEDKVVIETAVEISDSVIGPETFVGALTRVQKSLAWGNTLIDWRTGSCAHVPDAFLLCPLSQRYPHHTTHPTESWTDLCQLLLARAWQFVRGRKANLRQ